MTKKILLAALILYTGCYTVQWKENYNKAVEFYTSQKDNEAIGYLNMVLAEKPLLADAYRLLSFIYLRNGKYEEAKENAIKAIKYYKQKEYMKSIEPLNKRIGDCYIVLANVYAKKLEKADLDLYNKEKNITEKKLKYLKEKALYYAKKALELNPNNEEFLNRYKIIEKLVSK